MGRWLAAYAAAGEACRLAIEMSQTNLLAFDLHFLARVEAGLGLVDACRANALEALRLAAGFGSESIETYVHAVLGQLELSLGQVDESIQHLERAAELARRHGLGEPSVVQWAPDLVEAYVRSGQTERATRTLASFQLQANDTGRRGALAAAARCRGLLDEDDYEGAFAAAMAWHNETDTPFERARTELALGERRRRARRRAEARQPLRSALATFERLGAAVWVNRARQELRAAGAEPPAVRSSPSALLTAQELQIALHVSEGRTNQEVGAALFLSPKTVEHHLGRTYRKLKVRSRTELARVLGQDRQEPPRDRQ
jgi:DNA-binding CsgD family transcriptional regulator